MNTSDKRYCRGTLQASRNCDSLRLSWPDDSKLDYEHPVSRLTTPAVITRERLRSDGEGSAVAEEFDRKHPVKLFFGNVCEDRVYLGALSPQIWTPPNMRSEPCVVARWVELAQTASNKDVAFKYALRTIVHLATPWQAVDELANFGDDSIKEDEKMRRLGEENPKMPGLDDAMKQFPGFGEKYAELYGRAPDQQTFLSLVHMPEKDGSGFMRFARVAGLIANTQLDLIISGKIPERGFLWTFSQGLYNRRLIDTSVRTAKDYLHPKTITTHISCIGGEEGDVFSPVRSWIGGNYGSTPVTNLELPY